MLDNKPAFTEQLRWAERTHAIDVVALAKQKGLSREDFVSALDWFYGQDEHAYAHIVELWDETI